MPSETCAASILVPTTPLGFYGFIYSSCSSAQLFTYTSSSSIPNGSSLSTHFPVLLGIQRPQLDDTSVLNNYPIKNSLKFLPSQSHPLLCSFRLHESRQFPCDKAHTHKVSSTVVLKGNWTEERRHSINLQNSYIFLKSGTPPVMYGEINLCKEIIVKFIENSLFTGHHGIWIQLGVCILLFLRHTILIRSCSHFMNISGVSRNGRDSSLPILKEHWGKLRSPKNWRISRYDIPIFTLISSFCNF